MTGKPLHEHADATAWYLARHREAVLRPLAMQSKLSGGIVLATYRLRPQTSTLSSLNSSFGTRRT